VFWRDESADLSRTMAVLDSRLQRIETVMNWIHRRPEAAT
jgi:hypothetical protein